LRIILDFKKVSFPEPGWYSRGLKNTMFKWNGEAWTGETKMTLNANVEEHLGEVAMINAESKDSRKSRALAFASKILPLFVASSGVAAAIWYHNSRNSK
jgi:hypothetical protein